MAVRVFAGNRGDPSTEVYVRPFPEGNDKWPASRNGGGDPRWSKDGKELFYVEGATVVTVAIPDLLAWGQREATVGRRGPRQIRASPFASPA